MPPEKTDQVTFIYQADRGGQSEAICVKRLERNANGFWDKITKASVMTFASLFKKVKTRSAKEKKGTINADRSLFGRSLVVASHRRYGSSKLWTVERPIYALTHPDDPLKKTTDSILYVAELESVSPAVGRLPRSTLETVTKKALKLPRSSLRVQKQLVTLGNHISQ